MFVLKLTTDQNTPILVSKNLFSYFIHRFSKWNKNFHARAFTGSDKRDRHGKGIIYTTLKLYTSLFMAAPDGIWYFVMYGNHSQGHAAAVLPNTLKTLFKLSRMLLDL